MQAANRATIKHAATLAQLINATNALETAAADAAASLQVDISYENATVSLARLWSDIIIPKDRDDASDDGIASDYVQWLNISERKPNASIAEIIASLPCNQTNSALAAVSAASVELAAVVSNPSTRRAARSTSLVTSKAVWSAVDGLLYPTAAAAAGTAGETPGSEGAVPVYAQSWCYGLCPIGFPEDQVSQPKSLYSHDLHYEWATLNDVLLPAPGVVNATEVARIAASAARYQTVHGLRTHMFLDQRFLPSWAAASHPGITDIGLNHNVAFNMDHPSVREQMWAPILKQLVPALMAEMGDLPPLSYLVCNECFFLSPAVTRYTTQAWQSRLASVYNSSIAALNARWGTTFTAFTDITAFPLAPSSAVASAYSPTHPRAAWWDYTEFVRYRATSFFSWLAAEIRQYDPAALLHLKIMNEPFVYDNGDTGIDRDAHGRLLGLLGCDARSLQADSVPGYGGGEFYDSYWVEGRYSWDWRSMAIGYSLMRAAGKVHASALPTSPGIQALLRWSPANVSSSGFYQAPAFDSEVHAQSVPSRRTHDTRAAHISATRWLLHMTGIALHSTWYWGRAADGGIARADKPGNQTLPRPGPAADLRVAHSNEDAMRKAYWMRDGLGQPGQPALPFSYLTAPVATDAVGRAQLSINAVAGEIQKVAVGAPTPAGVGLRTLGLGPDTEVCYLFSVASKVHAPPYHQGGAYSLYTQAHITLFEAASMYGASRLRPVTEQSVAEAGLEACDGCAVMLLPAAGACLDSTVAALAAYAASRAQANILVLPAANTTAQPPLPVQDLACGMDEYGEARDPAALAFLSGAQVVPLQDPVAMLSGTQGLEAQLLSVSVPRPLRVVNITDPAQGTAFGVLTRWAEAQDGAGDMLLWLLNTRNEAVQVTLQWDAAHGGQYAPAGVDVLTGLTLPLGATGVSMPLQGWLFLSVPLP